MDQFLDWIKTNWHEESNMGKAKIGALAALLFLLISSMLPDSNKDSLTQELSGAPANDAVEIDAEAKQQAAATYSQYEARVTELEHDVKSAEQEATATYDSYATRVGELEQDAKLAAEQAAAAYQGYETRIGELERERVQLQSKLAAQSDMKGASRQAAAAYQGYEARIAELEQEKRTLQGEMQKLRSSDRAQVAEAYASYTARVTELEHEKAAARREAAQTYGQYEARVTDLEREVKTGEREAASTYAGYEARVADLEKENRRLSERLTAAEKALAAKTQRIAELEGSGRVYPNGATAGVNPEVKRQLEDLRGDLDRLLKQLQDSAPAQSQ